jgi:metallophosphoesterase (TIGR00282 family)
MRATASGLAPDMARAFLAAGADVITLGNHAWDRKEIVPYIAEERRLIRPLNYPPGTPGQGAVVVDVPGGRRALVLQVMTRLFMEPLDDPFRAAQAELARHTLGATVHAAVVDIHGEATAEKQGFAHSFDGKVSLVAGTHTHVPTADHQVLAGGTAFVTDAGMCGDYDSVIGMAKAPAALRFWRKVPSEKLAPAEGMPRSAGSSSRRTTPPASRAAASRCASAAGCRWRCRPPDASARRDRRDLDLHVPRQPGCLHRGARRRAGGEVGRIHRVHPRELVQVGHENVVETMSDIRKPAASTTALRFSSTCRVSASMERSAIIALVAGSSAICPAR